jgi:glycosyltransferase involved in cell wall biosynthesis
VQMTVWMPAPNRHLEPMLLALRAMNALRAVYYADAHLPAQMGTPPPAAEYRHHLADAAETTIAREVERGGMHLVYGFGHTLCRSVMRACRRQGAPYMVWGETLKPRARLSPLRILRDCVYAPLIKSAVAVLALSPAARNAFTGLGVDPSKVYPALYPGPGGSALPRARFGGTVTYCGRLIQRKNVESLIRAVSGTRGRVALEILGDGPLRPDLERLAQSTGALVDFVGPLSSADIEARLHRASVLILPTREWEGWGYVVNEAFAAGTPVIVSSTVGASELVVASHNGVVVRAGDPRSLGKAIGEVEQLYDSQVRLAEALAATQRAIEPRRFAQYLQEVGDSALRGAPRPDAPWHVELRRLGSNAAIAEWASSR